MQIGKILKESLIFAYSSLIVNKLRTFLSLLGITIGIFAIISVFTVIDTLERSITDSIASLGDDIIYIQKWPWEFGEQYPWWKYLQRPIPKLKELNQISKRSKKSQATAYNITASRTIKYKNNFVDNIIVSAASHDYDKIRNFEIEEGRYFSHFESHSGNAKIIIGKDLADGLFEGVNPIGKQIKINGIKVKVIGVFKKEGTDLFNQSMDNSALIPINYARNIVDLKNERLNPMIMVLAKENVNNQELIDELRGIMRGIRKLKPIEDDDFALNQSSLITQGFKQVFSTIDIAGIIIGGFAILVGGFGIANIMFVSVKERTRVIGIQKALGAKAYFIQLQFLYESVILSLIGGIVGLILIFIGTKIANTLIDMDMEFAMSFGNIATGIIISIIIGIISGWLPARSAAKLDPVNAMNSSF